MLKRHRILCGVLGGFLFVVLAVAGCGKKADPIPPRLILPPAIADLSADSVAEGILLGWSAPGPNGRIDHFRILRSEAAADQACPGCPQDYRPLATLKVADQTLRREEGKGIPLPRCDRRGGPFLFIPDIGVRFPGTLRGAVRSRPTAPGETMRTQQRKETKEKGTMNYFNYQDDQLFCEEVPVAEIAGEVGTPFYLYSHRTLLHHFRVFDAAFAEVPHIVCFAVKANSNTAILRLFVREGGGVDLVSGGELYRALKAGVDPGKVVYSGVGKREDEIDFALKTGILMFNVESDQELETINDRAAMLGVRAGIALRVNPDVDPETHPHISTGLRENKFGIDVEASLVAYRRASSLAHLDIKGVSCHIGSQVTKISPFIDALGRLKDLIRTASGRGDRDSLSRSRRGLGDRL